MHKFVRRYFRTLVMMLLAMVSYRLIVVPAIEPSDTKRSQPFVYNLLESKDHWWSRLFAQGSWQNQDPKVLQTDQGILLFDDWEQLGPDQWRLQPLTMILPQSHTSAGASTDAHKLPSRNLMTEQDVWVVNADKGAIIRFGGALDVTSGSTPPVIGGQLVGAMTITREAVKDNGRLPWKLITRNVSIDRRRIWTVEPVEIRWNDSVIRGRDLSIYMKGDLLGPPSDDPSPWGGLDNMELIYVDEIDVALPPGGLWTNLSQPEPPRESQSADQDGQQLPARLQVTAGGPFRFDFNSSTANLLGGVHMVHSLAGQQADEFWSQEVAATVDPLSRTTPANSQANPAASEQIKLGGMALQDFTAKGMDPVGDIVGEKWVEIKAPNIQFSMRAKRLEADLIKKQILLNGRLDHPQAISSIAKATYLGHEFLAPRIEYRAPPAQANQPNNAQANHLGWLVADGPGEMHLPPQSTAGEVNIRWKDSLKMLPDGPMQRIEMFGKTLVESKQHGLLTSDVLKIWLRPEPSPKVTSSTSSKSPPTSMLRDQESLTATHPSSKGTLPAAASTSFIPDRILAEGAVRLVASGLKARLNRLMASLVTVPDTQSEQMKQDSSALQLVDSNAPRPKNWIQQPATTEPSLAHQADTETSHREPIEIEGTVLKTRVISAAGNAWVDFLTIDGPLRIARSESDTRTLTPPDDATQLPWHIEGKQMRLETSQSGQANMHVVGEPARIVLAEGWLSGPSIHFDQKSNLVWMDQPGECSLPVSALNRGSNPQMRFAGGSPRTGSADHGVFRQSELAKSNLRWLKAPHCAWDGRMIFDGQQVNLSGNIEINGVAQPDSENLWFIQGFCQNLDLLLNQEVEFSQSNNRRRRRKPLDVQQVILREDVDLRAAVTDLRRERKSVQRILVPEVRFEPTQDKIICLGPGEIKAWQRTRSTPSQLVEGSRDDTRTTAAGVQASHLMFRDDMVGFLRRGETVVTGKVRLVTARVAGWDREVDLRSLQKLQPGQLLLDSDLLRAYDTTDLDSTSALPTSGSGGSTWEFQASGNVHFEGQTESGEFAGNGYRLTYVQAKSLLSLEGDGRMPAYIERTPADPTQEKEIKAHVFEAQLNTETMAVTKLLLSQFQVDFPGSDSSPASDPPRLQDQPSRQPYLPRNNNLRQSPRQGVSKWFERQQP